jgi:EAL domain-containing protein (putative c-di-GMP-specific phosphodiesterase class I)
MAFQPDVIKLDRRLIQGCSRMSLQQLLLKSLLYSAHELGILVVAEGLEDAEDIAFCRDIGVDLGQGFGLGRPDVILQHTRLDVLRFQAAQLQPVAIAAPAVPNVSQFSLRKRRFKRALNCI